MGRDLGVLAVLAACCVALACSSDGDSGGSGGSAGSGGGAGSGGSAGSGATGGAGGSSGAAGASGAAGSAGSGGGAGVAGAAGAAGAGGAAGAAGAGGVAGGGNDKTCQKLNEDYVKAVTAAKKCAYGTMPDPCSIKVKGDLDCQCPTYINPANTAAVAELGTIEASWMAAGCKASLACLCADPATGACYAGTGGPADGSCHDS